MENNLYSLQIEQAVLSSLMGSHGNVDEFVDDLSENNFYAPKHKIIFSEIKALHAQGKQFDVIMVWDQIRLDLQKSKMVTEQYIQEVIAIVCLPSQLEGHIVRLRELTVWRKIHEAGERIQLVTRNIEQSPDQALSLAQNILNEIDSDDEGDTLQDASYFSKIALQECVARHEAWHNNKPIVKGVTTGFRDLDDMLGELENGDLICIGARASMGKTTLLQNIAQDIALRQKKPALFISAEMKGAPISQRLISSIAKVNFKVVKTGVTTDGEVFSRMANAQVIIDSISLKIDEKPGASLSDIRRSARRVKAQYGEVGAILVDYLQKLESPIKAPNRKDLEIAAISDGLKKIAIEFNCPVISLVQIGRSVEKNGDKRPKNSDIRDSGAIEQDADVIMMIYRDDYYNKDSKEKGIAEIIITKCRNGEVGTVRLATDLAHCRFVTLDINHHLLKAEDEERLPF